MIKFDKTEKPTIICKKFIVDGQGITDSYLPFEKIDNSDKVNAIHVQSIIESNDATSISFDKSTSTLTCGKIIENADM